MKNSLSIYIYGLLVALAVSDTSDDKGDDVNAVNDFGDIMGIATASFARIDNELSFLRETFERWEKEDRRRRLSQQVATIEVTSDGFGIGQKVWKDGPRRFAHLSDDDMKEMAAYYQQMHSDAMAVIERRRMPTDPVFPRQVVAASAEKDTMHFIDGVVRGDQNRLTYSFGGKDVVIYLNKHLQHKKWEDLPKDVQAKLNTKGRVHFAAVFLVPEGTSNQKYEFYFVEERTPIKAVLHLRHDPSDKFWEPVKATKDDTTHRYTQKIHNSQFNLTIFGNAIMKGHLAKYGCKTVKGANWQQVKDDLGDHQFYNYVEGDKWQVELKPPHTHKYQVVKKSNSVPLIYLYAPDHKF